MERMRLALEIDNYPEWIILDNYDQEEIKNPHGRGAHTGRAKVMLDLEDFKNLLDPVKVFKLINLKTNKEIPNAVFFIEEETYDIVYCVPKRVYTKKKR